MAGPFDLFFFDADRPTAPDQLRLLLPRLASRAVLVADDVLSHPAQVRGYLDALAGLNDLEHAVVPVGKGRSIACRATPYPDSEAAESTTELGSILS